MRKQNAFFQPVEKFKRRWGAPAERERHRRIKIAIAAYAYDIMDDPIMSDAAFDKLASEINLKTSTENKKMDQWFRDNFKAHTGMWVRKHPNKKGLANLYWKIKKWRTKGGQTNYASPKTSTVTLGMVIGRQIKEIRGGHKGIKRRPRKT